jgi:hypothetical protein
MLAANMRKSNFRTLKKAYMAVRFIKRNGSREIVKPSALINADPNVSNPSFHG